VTRENDTSYEIELPCAADDPWRSWSYGAAGQPEQHFASLDVTLGPVPVVRALDEVAGHYTRVHSLTAAQVAEAIRLAKTLAATRAGVRS